MRSVTQALATVQAWGRKLGVGVASLGLGSQAWGWGRRLGVGATIPALYFARKRTPIPIIILGRLIQSL